MKLILVALFAACAPLQTIAEDAPPDVQAVVNAASMVIVRQQEVMREMADEIARLHRSGKCS